VALQKSQVAHFGIINRDFDPPSSHVDGVQAEGLCEKMGARLLLVNNVLRDGN